jgi:16S rRNA (guanine527-N7)-methyltransferase
MTEAIPPLPQQLEIWQQTLDWQPTGAQQVLLEGLYQAIVTTNRSFNLTRITEPTEFWEKHLWDSMRGIKPWLHQPSQPLKLIDMGTGAGFPGLPIAIAQPDWQLTLVDSTQKKVKFVQQTAQALGLNGVRGISERAEVLGQSRNFREQFDLATIRAVAAVSVCAEYLLPLLKVGGQAILYRGQWDAAEEAACIGALQNLGGELRNVDLFNTPISEGTRSCVYLQKIAPTPLAYPRSVGLPVQKPL